MIFFGDNGTANGRGDQAMIGGRRLDGAKGSMLEGGSREPLIVRWPGVTAPGKTTDDLVDSTDFMPTLAELAGAALPTKNVLDGRSFVPQLRGEKGNPRDHVFLQLARMWYVRDAGWKLTQDGELFNMRHAPYEQELVPADTKDPVALAERARLQAALDQLNPAGGHLDNGDGSGRHANKKAKKKN